MIDPAHVIAVGEGDRQRIAHLEAQRDDLRILLQRTISREPGALPKGQLRTTITAYLRRLG